MMANYLDGLGKNICGSCGLVRTPEGHDGCIGTLPNVRNACCGHGENRMAYVQFDHEDYQADPNKYLIEGQAAIDYILANRNLISTGNTQSRITQQGTTMLFFPDTPLGDKTKTHQQEIRERLITLAALEMMLTDLDEANEMLAADNGEAGYQNGDECDDAVQIRIHNNLMLEVTEDEIQQMITGLEPYQGIFNFPLEKRKLWNVLIIEDGKIVACRSSYGQGSALNSFNMLIQTCMEMTEVQAGWKSKPAFDLSDLSPFDVSKYRVPPRFEVIVIPPEIAESTKGQ